MTNEQTSDDEFGPINLNDEEPDKIPPDVYAYKRLRERLEKLRSTWAEYAVGIERVYGWDDPAVKALRCCIDDLYDALRIGKKEPAYES